MEERREKGREEERNKYWKEGAEVRKGQGKKRGGKE
jgi:hypothetical protein